MASEQDLQLWDITGLDGLQVARALFGQAIGQLAVFLSMETVLNGQACSVLRLCDRNFRIVYPGNINKVALSKIARPNALPVGVQIQQYAWLKRVVLPIEFLSPLTERLTVRAPHRVKNLPNHQAAPAQLDDIAILIWQHPIKEKPVVELHVAANRRDNLIAIVSSKEGNRSLTGQTATGQRL